MSKEQSVPPKLVSSNDVSWKDWDEVPDIGERYRHLSSATLGENYRVGIAIEELEPGKRSAPAHYHIFEEEHVFILEGALSVRLGDTLHDMKTGDYICFPAGQKTGHCLINNSGAACRYVIIGERNRNEVVIYTDSNKVLVRSLGRRAIFDMAATRGYWDGEDTGLPPGVSPPPDRPGHETDAEPTPKLPIASENLEWQETAIDAKFGGQVKHLTYAAVGTDYHVGVLIEAPAPGKRLAPRHYHMLEEEHALILEGEVTLLFGDQEYAMRPGDFVSFPAGERIGHSLMNSGSGPCRYLMIGERNPAEVCVYPDSNKMAVATLHPEHEVFDMSATRRYWDGEATA